jgi:hypothetical protein
MAQFYFLSILLNVIAGLILFYGKDFTREKLSEEDETLAIDDDTLSEKGAFFRDLGFDSLSFRFVIGVLSLFVAVMKILSPFKGSIPVLGDLLPVLSGIIAGFTLILENYVSKASSDIYLSEPVQKIFIDSRSIIGIACFAAAFFHFMFPQVILL